MSDWNEKSKQISSKLYVLGKICDRKGYWLGDKDMPPNCTKY